MIPFSRSRIHDDIAAVDRELRALATAEQEEGEWPAVHPLPLPAWGEVPRQPYRAPTLCEYERLATNIELYVQRLLEERHYDTVGNFIELHRSYAEAVRRAGDRTDDDGGDGGVEGVPTLDQHFRRYRPPLSAARHTCVGLALELWLRLRARFPRLAPLLYVASCEEAIDDDVAAYCDAADVHALAATLEKEHVLLAMRVEVAGRAGVLLCDPGYHVARVVTVMRDRLYPHTGWFAHSDRKEYCYTLSRRNERYVEWSERPLTATATVTVTVTDTATATPTAIDDVIAPTHTSLIYVARPYLTAVDVTERRNLVYDFRSLVARDTKGRLLAGLYFKLQQPHFTVFHEDERRKIPFEAVLDRTVSHFTPALILNTLTLSLWLQLNTQDNAIINECNSKLRLADGRLLNILTELANIMADVHYVTQLLNINNSINSISVDE